MSNTPHSALNSRRLIDNLDYMPGFGNQFESETLPDALPHGQNNPQQCPYGLYAEQLSGSPFTAPNETNARIWFYRIRPSVRHGGRFNPVDVPHWESAPHRIQHGLALGQLRWGPIGFPRLGVDFVHGIRTMTTAGDASTHTGMATHTYAFTASMVDDYCANADGEMLLVPEDGDLTLYTEAGIMNVAPLEVAVIPRGMVFKVLLGPGVKQARGYLCENYGRRLTLPERGPIGANGLANPRDFLTPVAAYEDNESACRLIVKWGGEFHQTELDQSPLDVVAWHGNFVPFKYDLECFSPVGSILFDHPDPSIFTVLTSASGEAGTANIDFVIFPPRWMVAENTFRPPWYHRNIMSEFMGLITGQYDAKEEGFVPGGMSLHNMMVPHGPDVDAFTKATEAALAPVKLENTMAFMFETFYPQQLTEFAATLDTLDTAYADCWSGITRRFNGTPNPD